MSMTQALDSRLRGGKVLLAISKGVQSIPPPNRPLGQKIYFDLSAIKRQKTQEEFSGLALSA